MMFTNRLFPNPLTATRRLGWLVMGTLLLFSIRFYLERMVLLDMSFQCFHILRTGELQVQSGRFGAAATQFFPWIACHAGFSLKGVLLFYSLGHELYYLILFVLLAYGLRSWTWTLVLLLVKTLMTTHSFYWLSEMMQGLGFLVLLMAWLDSREQLRRIAFWQWPLLAAGAVTAFYFHPMILYAALFAVAYFWSGFPEKTGRKGLFAALGVLFVAAAVVKYKVLKLDWYDAAALERAEAFRQLWPHWFDIQSNRDFLAWCLRDYYMIPLLVLLNTTWQIRQRQYLRAACCALIPFGFVILVNVPFHTGDRQFYLENLYLPLGLMTALPLVFGIVTRFSHKKTTWYLLGALLILRLIHIGQRHEGWSERLAWEQDFLRCTHGNLLLNEQQAPMNKLILSWGSSTEFLMLSALEHPDSARCILIDEHPERFDSLSQRSGLFLSEFKNYPYTELPAAYFRPKMQGYQYFKAQ
jgi:hypothetical protein